MNSDKPNPERPLDLENHLVVRAWKDPAFKRELLRDPKATIQRELAKLHPGVTLPADVEVQVLEETPKKVYIVLPNQLQETEPGQLSDAELESVAGGLTSTGVRFTGVRVCWFTDSWDCVSVC